MAECFVALDLTAEQMVLGLNRGLGTLKSTFKFKHCVTET